MIVFLWHYLIDMTDVAQSLSPHSSRPHGIRQIIGNNSPIAQVVKNPSAMQETQEMRFQSLVSIRKILRRRAWQPTPIFLSGESHGQRRLVGYSPRGRRVRHDQSNLICRHSYVIFEPTQVLHPPHVGPLPVSRAINAIRSPSWGWGWRGCL